MENKREAEEKPKTTFKVIRGELANFGNSQLKIMQDLLGSGKIKEAHNMITSTRFSRNYSGAMYSICFKVNQPIVLTSVGFWGPFTGQRSSYRAKILVLQSVNPCEVSENLANDTILGKNEVTVEAEPKEIFTVNLYDEPLVAPNRWTRIRFQLDGPDTCVCSSVKSFYKCDESNVEFEFLASSSQLPVISYQLPGN